MNAEKVMTDHLDEIKRFRAEDDKLLSRRSKDHLDWLIPEVERLRKRNTLVEESFEQAMRDWHSACNDIDKQNEEIERLRGILDAAIDRQGGLGHELNKADAAIERLRSERQDYYNEASKGWSKFRDAERIIAILRGALEAIVRYWQRAVAKGDPHPGIPMYEVAQQALAATEER